MQSALIKARNFQPGANEIISESTAMGMNFCMLWLKEGQSFEIDQDLETACLLLEGSVFFSHKNFEVKAQRKSVFNDSPCAVHLSIHDRLKIKAISDSELILLSCTNAQYFDAVYFDENNISPTEHRGQGLLDNTAYRLVRTIFDKNNRPSANLVLGEVVTFPGRWSSYPPHHHPQPEIYHYRFSEAQGYGLAEMGSQIFRVGHNDTLAISPHCIHSQVSAPGYAMMYVWAIKHLPDAKYQHPTFNEEHSWTMNTNANERVWCIKDKS